MEETSHTDLSKFSLVKTDYRQRRSHYPQEECDAVILLCLYVQEHSSVFTTQRESLGFESYQLFIGLCNN